MGSNDAGDGAEVEASSEVVVRSNNDGADVEASSEGVAGCNDDGAEVEAVAMPSLSSSESDDKPTQAHRKFEDMR